MIVACSCAGVSGFVFMDTSDVRTDLREWLRRRVDSITVTTLPFLTALPVLWKRLLITIIYLKIVEKLLFTGNNNSYRNFLNDNTKKQREKIQRKKCIEK